MASPSETGHAKNVENFEDLALFCTGYTGQIPKGQQDSSFTIGS